MFLFNRQYRQLIKNQLIIMGQNEVANAALDIIQTQLTKLQNDATVIIADVTASKNAGEPVSDDTVTRLQTLATALSTTVGAIDAAVNPPVTEPTEETPAPTEPAL